MRFIPRGIDEVEGNEPAQPLPVYRFDDDMSDVLSHGIYNHAPHLTARPIATAHAGTDLDDLVTAGRASRCSASGLALPGFMSVLVGGSRFGDLHSVSSVQIGPRCRHPGRIGIFESRVSDGG